MGGSIYIQCSEQTILNGGQSDFMHIHCIVDGSSCNVIIITDQCGQNTEYVH